MKNFNKKILVASIAIVLGTTTSAWANSKHHGYSGKGQKASAFSISKGTGSSSANKHSTATTDNTNNSDNSLTDKSDNRLTDKSDNSLTDNSDNSVTDKSDNSLTDNSDNSLTDNSDNSYSSAGGTGTASANNGGIATANYKVNDSYLDGTVTGNTLKHSLLAVQAVSNNIDNSFNGAAGINQTVMNNGANSLAQQQVSFQGNVNVNQ